MCTYGEIHVMLFFEYILLTEVLVWEQKKCGNPFLISLIKLFIFLVVTN